MGIRSLIPGFALTALVAAGMTVPTVVQAGDVRIDLHGHFDLIGHNYGYKQHYGHRHRHGYHRFAPRRHYGHSYGYGRKRYYGHPYWYGRKHHYGKRHDRNPRLDRRHRKHHRRQAGRGFSDVVAPQPRRKRR